MQVQFMTKAQYSRHRGCDEKAVRKAIIEKRISLIDGKIDPVVADIQWANNTRARGQKRVISAFLPGQQGFAQGNGVRAAVGAALDSSSDSAGGDSRGGPGQVGAKSAGATGAGGENSYGDARARREVAEATRSELEVAVMAGKLLQRDSTERAVFDAFRALRDAAFAVPARAAAKVVGLIELRDIEHVFTEELRKSFDHWEARMAEQLAAKGSP